MQQHLTHLNEWTRTGGVERNRLGKGFLCLLQFSGTGINISQAVIDGGVTRVDATLLLKLCCCVLHIRLQEIDLAKHEVRQREIWSERECLARLIGRQLRKI